jgi:hypothetical protein
LSTCYDIFLECATAIRRGVLIESVSAKDKEYHFQNWFDRRLANLGIEFDEPGRNTYPDFRLVKTPEGYEVKALAWPGRERDYDSNSQVPTGHHNGRTIFYVFGRYPADNGGSHEYPVVDLVICHGDFLNADHDYSHKNKNVKGFGTYGDIMIRDRKMYVAPTPFALTQGTTGAQTLIVPASYPTDQRFVCVGDLVRIEAERVVVGYSFDLTNNTLTPQTVSNPRYGEKHFFKAYRAVGSEEPVVRMVDKQKLKALSEGAENAAQ